MRCLLNRKVKPQDSHAKAIELQLGEIAIALKTKRKEGKRLRPTMHGGFLRHDMGYKAANKLTL